jgi:hypothetical protein
MKLGMYIMAHDPISSICVYVYPPIVDRQLLGIKVTAATNTQIRTEELFDAAFSMESVSYQKKVGDKVFQELFV